jgi:hypothetical protein
MAINIGSGEAKKTGYILSAAVNDALAAATGFITTLTEATNTHYKGLICLFTSGVLKDQARVVDTYTGATKTLSFITNAFTEAPTTGDTFDLYIGPGALLSYAITLIDDLEAIVKLQTVVAVTTIDLHQAAANYTLFTGTTQHVVLENILIRLPNVNVSDDAAITSISIQTNDTTAQTFISSVQGAKANLTANAQLSWSGQCMIDVGALIQLTIAGGTADATTTCDVIAIYRAAVAGGTLE